MVRPVHHALPRSFPAVLQCPFSVVSSPMTPSCNQSNLRLLYRSISSFCSPIRAVLQHDQWYGIFVWWVCNTYTRMVAVLDRLLFNCANKDNDIILYHVKIGISRDLCKFPLVCSSVCIHKKLFRHLFRTTHKQGERCTVLPVWFFVFYLAVRCIARKFLILPKSDQITRQTK